MNKKIIVFIYMMVMINMCAEKGIPINGELGLTEEQLKSLETNILLGERSWSRVFEHYSMFLDLFSEGQYWLEKGAENGDKIACYNYSFMLKETNPYRSFFYISLSAKLNFEKAKEYLGKNDIPQINNNLEQEDVNLENLQEFMNNAELGGVIHAERLAAYFKNEDIDFKNTSIDRIQNKNSSIYWYHVGAINGSKLCMKKYSEILKQGNEYDIQRSFFWEQKSLEE